MIRTYLGGGNSKIFNIHPDPWRNDPVWLYNIFQMGWFNHQPVKDSLGKIEEILGKFREKPTTIRPFSESYDGKLHFWRRNFKGFC